MARRPGHLGPSHPRGPHPTRWRPVAGESLPNLERPQHVRPPQAGFPHRRALRGLTTSVARRTSRESDSNDRRLPTRYGRRVRCTIHFSRRFRVQRFRFKVQGPKWSSSCRLDTLPKGSQLMTASDLVARLTAHKTLGPAGPEEMAWLASHGSLRQLGAGDVLTAKGTPPEGMFIVLSGCIAISVDRGAGLHKIMEWRGG